MKEFYRRHLPHIQPPGATFFITFRLYGSLPKEAVGELHREYMWIKQKLHSQRNLERTERRLKELYDQQKRLMAKYDRYLHQCTDGPHFLRDPRIANLVCEALKYWDQKRYDLLCYCVMSNHVHLVCTPLRDQQNRYYPLAKIMHSIKSYTATKANRILHRTGQRFWQDESFDHYCRSTEEIQRVMEYVLNNPVVAGLVDNPWDWPWSYCKFW